MILLYILIGIFSILLCIKIDFIFHLIDTTFILTVKFLGLKYIYDTSKQRDRNQPKNTEKKEKDEGYTSNEIKKKFNKGKLTFNVYKKLFYKTLRLLKKKITIKNFLLNLNFGTGDAADTAITYGIIWGAWGNILGLLNSFDIKLNPKSTSIIVNPDFTSKKFDLEIYGILTTRPVHIIYIAFVTGTYYLMHKLKIIYTNKRGAKNG